MSGRALIISDTHFGRTHRWPWHRPLTPESLRPLWQGFDDFIINGDVAEVHHPRHWSRAARMVLRLHDLCEADGVRLTLLSGNHDPYLTDLRHLHMAGGAIFMTHGDAFHPAIAPWSPAAGRLRAAHERALTRLEALGHNDLESRLQAAQFAAHAEWAELEHEAGQSTMLNMLLRPRAAARVWRYWRAFPQLAADFGAEHAPRARFIIVGHTHRSGFWSLGERVVINTGSFEFPGRPWGVAIDDAALSVHRIEREGGGYRLSARANATFALPAGSGREASPLQPPGTRRSGRSMTPAI
jgi:predicted phosphodiesterase